MAERFPTDFTRWIDEQKIRRTLPLLQTQPDQIAEDLQYLRDAPQLLYAGNLGVPRSTTEADPGVVAATFRLQAKDICGTGQSTTVNWRALVASLDGDEGEIKLAHAGDSQTLAFDNTVPAIPGGFTIPFGWVNQTGLIVPSDGVNVTFTVSIYRTAGAGGGVALAGIEIVSAVGGEA